MDIRKVKKLIELLDETGVAEIEIRSRSADVREVRVVPLWLTEKEPLAPVPDVARRRLVDAPDQLGFRVALERGQAMAKIGRLLGESFVHLFERDLPVDARLAQAEQVQVRPVQ